MKIKKIKVQWLLHLFLFTIFLIVLNTIFIIYRKQQCYNYAQKILNFSSATIDFKIELLENNNSASLSDEIKKIIENFKNNIGTIAVGFNMNEKAVVSSNKNLCSTYEQLLKTIKHRKINPKNKTFRCHLANGEHIMLKIKPVPVANSEFSSIIYILSLNEFDRIILNTATICLLISSLMVSLLFINGQFFIKKLLIPVVKISKITKKMANGQSSLTIQTKFNHELKDLCNAINIIAKKLRSSEYAQNEFISSISHELRTPLTAIKGWSETIQNSNADEKILNKGMAIISKEVTRLSKMIEELLDFSKIRNGHLKLFKEKMDPFAELQESILIYSEIAKKQNKNLTYKEQAVVPTIFGDKNRIKQVFINIIDNALKYSNAGATVSIEAVVGEKTADVIIKDSGKGIAKQHLNHITEKFFKANSTKSGSGIGLAVVKEIVQKHDGTLQFESKQNKGTTVKVSFPLFKPNNKS